MAPGHSTTRPALQNLRYRGLKDEHSGQYGCVAHSMGRDTAHLATPLIRVLIIRSTAPNLLRKTGAVIRSNLYRRWLSRVGRDFQHLLASGQPSSGPGLPEVRRRTAEAPRSSVQIRTYKAQQKECLTEPSRRPMFVATDLSNRSHCSMNATDLKGETR